MKFALFVKTGRYIEVMMSCVLCSIFRFLLFVSFLETGFSCITILAVLEPSLINQASLELTGIYLLCLLSAGIKGVHHHRLAVSYISLKIGLH